SAGTSWTTSSTAIRSNTGATCRAAGSRSARSTSCSRISRTTRCCSAGTSPTRSWSSSRNIAHAAAASSSRSRNRASCDAMSSRPTSRTRTMSDRVAPIYACPSCGGHAERPFYEVHDVPVHQVKLVRTRADALNCAKGDIRLCFCPNCGFVWNGAFDPARMRYEDDYESTQAVSPTFNAFHERLARDLIERFDLRGKRVVELGCGQGEFVTMLAEMGGNEGFGFDQVIREPGVCGRVTFVKDLYAEPYRDLEPDFVCCKMTLEHVHAVSDFLRSLRRTVGDRPETVVFFMIPEVTRILNLRAFWDIYYEHCSYWSPGSLARAFRIAGFDPVPVWTDYADQYVLIAARPS